MKNAINTQIVIQNDVLPVGREGMSLADWLEAYLQLEDTSAESSRKVKRYDIGLFLKFIVEQTGSASHADWTPRFSQEFKDSLQKQLENGKRRWNDRTINRILAHLNTFAKWIHQHRPFQLGNPMAKIKTIPTENLIEVERALTKSEESRMLDAADDLLQEGGRSKDRNRYRKKEKRPQRKGYRPYRNRAIIYTLIGTGIRRAAITKLDVDDVDFDKEQLAVVEKGNVEKHPWIAREALAAIRDYLRHERPNDARHLQSRALFLPAEFNRKSNGRLSPQMINIIWNNIREKAQISADKTPHSARHAVGVRIVKKNGNPAAVQRQLGHKNGLYSLQYMRPSEKDMKDALNER